MDKTNPFDLPDDRYYDAESHLWLKRDEQTGRIVVGINTIGLDILGDLAFVSLADVGSAVRRGDVIGSLEAAKMTTELIVPISGIVIGCNEEVLKDPMKVNEDPYGKGWLFSIDPSDWEKEKAELVSGEAIADYAARAKEQMASQNQIN